MTPKRFNRVGGYVYDGDKCISHFEDVAHRDDIVKLLNELHEENEQLKKQIGNLEHTRDFADEVCVDCERLEHENEQLKQEIKAKDKIIELYYEMVKE